MVTKTGRLRTSYAKFGLRRPKSTFQGALLGDLSLAILVILYFHIWKLLNPLHRARRYNIHLESRTNEDPYTRYRSTMCDATRCVRPYHLLSQETKQPARRAHTPMHSVPVGGSRSMRRADRMREIPVTEMHPWSIGIPIHTTQPLSVYKILEPCASQTSTRDYNLTITNHGNI